MHELDRTVAILGSGHAVPDRRVTNAELKTLISGYDEESGDFATWVDRVTHIQERRFSDTSEDGVHVLGLAASRQALESSGVDPREIDHLILCSFTFHDLYPGVHSSLVRDLELQCGSFICTVACSGSLWGITLARSLVQSGQCRNVLVVGVECMSRTLNFNDPLTAIIFGDAAGAVVVGRKNADAPGGFLGRTVWASEYSPDTIQMLNNNSPNDCRQSADQETHQERHMVRMGGGPRVLRNAVTKMAECVAEVLGHTPDDLKANAPALREQLARARVIPHQANGRILDGLESKLGLAREQLFRTIYVYGNSSAATNLLTYDYGVRVGNMWREPPADGTDGMGTVVPCGGRIERGDLVVMTAIGAGYQYGAVAFEQA